MNQSNFNLEFKRVVDLSICPETPTGIDKVITGYDIDDENWYSEKSGTVHHQLSSILEHVIDGLKNGNELLFLQHGLK